MTSIEVIVGAQAGSEAKGHVAAQRVRALAKTGTVLNVRVAGPNAGHTVMYPDGASRASGGYDGGLEPVALRTLPVGLVADPRAVAYIAPGSEVDIEVLATELQTLRGLGIDLDGRLFVSGQATVLTDKHRIAEAGAGLTVDSGKSTGKGIGAARADRAMRMADLVQTNTDIIDLVESVGGWVVGGRFNVWGSDHIVVEGTQGYVLGLHAGYYPLCTSSDCRAIDFLAMAGISPWDGRCSGLRVFAIARTYPIRIAGNSGPLPKETSWSALGLPEELTTVTKRVRRVAHWDPEWVRNAVQANGGGVGVGGPVQLVITMLDQKFSWTRDLTGSDLYRDRRWLEQVDPFLYAVERDTGAKIAAVTTGPDTIHYFI